MSLKSNIFSLFVLLILESLILTPIANARTIWIGEYKHPYHTNDGGMLGLDTNNTQTIKEQSNGLTEFWYYYISSDGKKESTNHGITPFCTNGKVSLNPKAKNIRSKKLGWIRVTNWEPDTKEQDIKDNPYIEADSQASKKLLEVVCNLSIYKVN